MVGYDDAYNRQVTAKSNAKVRAHATNIDRLNGSGKACCARCKNCKGGRGMSGGASDTPISVKKWYEAEDRNFEDQVHQTITPQSVREARAELDIGSGRQWGTPEQERIGNIQNLRASEAVRKRMYGSGFMDKLGMATKVGNVLAQNLLSDTGKSGKLKKAFGVADSVRGALQGEGVIRTMRGCGDQLSSNPNVTPPEVARKRAALDLGAGRFQGGAAEYDDVEDDDEDYEDGDDCGELEGGATLRSGKSTALPSKPAARRRPSSRTCCFPAKVCRGNEKYSGGAADMEETESDEPESLREMNAICDDYEQKKLTGGAMTKRVRAMLPHGKKAMSVALSKALQKLKKRARNTYDRRVKAKLSGISSEGSGRYVGGSDQDRAEIRRIHSAIFGSSKCSGGNAPVAPTTEALSGYDNRDQPSGLVPPPSVNQQKGMKGGAVPLNKGEPLAKKARPSGGVFQTADIRPDVMGYKNYKKGSPWMGEGVSGGRPLVPVAQMPSKIGGGKFSKQGDYIGPSTGAIIPELQSDAAPAGSGKMSRGAMVARLMKEKGMSLGEASKALKGGRYTANDFFMPKNIHQFFGAYA